MATKRRPDPGLPTDPGGRGRKAPGNHCGAVAID